MTDTRWRRADMATTARADTARPDIPVFDYSAVWNAADDENAIASRAADLLKPAAVRRRELSAAGAPSARAAAAAEESQKKADPLGHLSDEDLETASRKLEEEQAKRREAAWAAEYVDAPVVDNDGEIVPESEWNPEGVGWDDAE